MGIPTAILDPDRPLRLLPAQITLPRHRIRVMRNNI
jgi:hypothetical protein